MNPIFNNTPRVIAFSRIWSRHENTILFCLVALLPCVIVGTPFSLGNELPKFNDSQSLGF